MSITRGDMTGYQIYSKIQNNKLDNYFNLVYMEKFCTNYLEKDKIYKNKR